MTSTTIQALGLKAMEGREQGREQKKHRKLRLRRATWQTRHQAHAHSLTPFLPLPIMKKGFLTSAAKAPRKAAATTVKPPIVELQEQQASLAPYGGLPPELIIQCIEQLVSQGGARVQQDIASLRRASKVLCGIATPHFYRTVELVSTSRVKSLITQLQANPKLCDTTRAIWWDEMESGQQPMESTKPYLCRFANVDQVAFCSNVHNLDAPIGLSMGLQFALRNVGP